MQLLSIGVARSIWLFDINELNPKGRSLFPDVLLWAGEKYSFESFPKSMAEVDQEKKAYLFTRGEFQSDEGPIDINFSIYADGMVAETWASTEKGDQFLDEILRSATSKFGLTFGPETVQTKQYVSEIVVRLENDLTEISHNFAQFCGSLSGLFGKHHLPPFEMTGMIFSPDISASSYKPPGFLIERKSGFPFKDNRFWSKAPFATEDHLFLLEQFEKLLAG
jgi:hypothetical protein